MTISKYAGSVAFVLFAGLALVVFGVSVAPATINAQSCGKDALFCDIGQDYGSGGWNEYDYSWNEYDYDYGWNEYDYSWSEYDYDYSWNEYDYTWNEYDYDYSWNEYDSGDWYEYDYDYVYHDDWTSDDWSYTDVEYSDWVYDDWTYDYWSGSSPTYRERYQPYYSDYSYSYNDYWYSNPPRDDRPRYDSPTCVIRVSDKTPDEGDYVTVSWDADDADEATLTGFGDVNPRSGSERIRVNSDRTFTLRVEGRGGSDTCSISVHVDEEEEDDDLRCELDASDTSIEEGDTTTLEWDTRGDVRRASINQGIGSVDEDGGTERVRPNRTTTYRLTVEDRDGDEEECDVTVRVDEDDSLPPPPDVPLVYLSQLPYTGAEDGPMYWILLIVGSGLAGYFTLFRAVPFAYARVKMLRSDTDTEVLPVGEGEVAPQNVTRQDVRAFVSAIAEGDTASAREFARAGGEVLFSEAAVVLDDVVRARDNGSVADPMVKDMTKGWDASKFATLVEAFANAKDESVVEKVIG